MIDYEATIACDWPPCHTTERMNTQALGPIGPPAYNLPDGWIQVNQGLGFTGGMGTFPLPKNIDLVIMGRTYCSAYRLALDLLGQMQDKANLREGRQEHDEGNGHDGGTGSM